MDLIIKANEKMLSLCINKKKENIQYLKDLEDYYYAEELRIELEYETAKRENKERYLKSKSETMVDINKFEEMANKLSEQLEIFRRVK